MRGTLPSLSPSAAIVGTRRASPEALELVEAIAFELATGGVTIVSGGALGIDGAAHRGAVRAGKPTIVVLPTSLKKPSPPSHRALFDRVLETGGAWISEHDREARRSDFRTRNRLIAALADVVLVAQATARSGTWHTIDAAKKLKKTIAAIPWSPNDPRGETCVELLKHGAPAITSARDVFALLDLRIPRAPKIAPADLSELDTKIIALIREGATSTEAIAGRLDIAASTLLAAITELELSGHLVVDPSGALRARARS